MTYRAADARKRGQFCFHKGPYISAKESCIFAKEPYISVKRSHISANKPCPRIYLNIGLFYKDSVHHIFTSSPPSPPPHIWTYTYTHIYIHISFTESPMPESGGQNRCFLTKNPTSLQKRPTKWGLYIHIYLIQSYWCQKMGGKTGVVWQRTLHLCKRALHLNTSL